MASSEKPTEPVETVPVSKAVADQSKAALQLLHVTTKNLVKTTGDYSLGLARITKAAAPLYNLLLGPRHITVGELNKTLNEVFDSLYSYRLTRDARVVTALMRSRNLIPNEQSTERLIRFTFDQVTLRSPVPVPEEIGEQFWKFFDELLDNNELRGMGEISLGVLRTLLKSYEPLIVSLANQLKDLRADNDQKIREIVDQASIVSKDLVIIRRQIRALRHIKAYFSIDPKDFGAQAKVVAKMVREFGPLFTKMAQVAAANTDFLPEEIARELAVFQEDVEPMTPEDVEEAFLECFGQLPYQRYLEFDSRKPIKSGSIASVFVAKRPFMEDGREVLRRIVVKVGRSNLDREFLMGKTVVNLAILTSEYWAPHSKLTPFLNALQNQVEEFVEGFNKELDFELEGENQYRFEQRSHCSSRWHVPEIYIKTSRIIEMEYLHDASSLPVALASRSFRKSAKRRAAARDFLYTTLTHMLIDREFHGDLHPGNIMLRKSGELYLIDWGNTVNLKGMWQPYLGFLRASFSADGEAIVDTVGGLCLGDGAGMNREETLELVEATLEKYPVTPMGSDFILTLYQEGFEGLRLRLEQSMNLLSSLSKQGLIVKHEYIHLSRSITAMVGSYMKFYDRETRSAMLVDLLRTLAEFPVLASLDSVKCWQKRLLRKLPF